MLQPHGLAGRAVDFAGEGRGGNREGVADDAGEPFVIGVLQRDVDGERDLLDRAHAVALVGAHVARQVEKLVGGEVGRRHAVERLLIGRVGRLRRAPILGDQGLDGRLTRVRRSSIRSITCEPD
jgi:hypothetical protein